MSINLAIAKAEALANSSLFDVHRWSVYPEVNKAVDHLYQLLKSVAGFGGNANIRKKHLKVVVLDLYVKWLTDPAMYSSYYRADSYYIDLDGRYNKLHISRITPKVVDALHALGYVEHTMGHYGREVGSSSHMSRMRATPKLIDLIQGKFHCQPEMVELCPDAFSSETGRKNHRRLLGIQMESRNHSSFL